MCKATRKKLPESTAERIAAAVGKRARQPLPSHRAD
jgi:hypothetical protein